MEQQEGEHANWLHNRNAATVPSQDNSIYVAEFANWQA